MKYLPLRELDAVTDALNFDTADCHVIGSCDIYTTKAAGGDKKLYKDIEHDLESEYASLLSFSAGLSAQQAKAAASSLNLARASPFGPLSQISSRRTFAYLIATLNASHPDYDFSHCLRPSDFKREKSLKRVMNTIDTTLYNLRPRFFSSLPDQSDPRFTTIVVPATVPQTPHGSEKWNPRMWALIDKEMSLRQCTTYSYSPVEDPYEGEEGALWSFHYFFFNKDKKRVCYLNLRGMSIFGSSSPPPVKTPVKKTKRPASGTWSIDEETSKKKRAKYWFGDKAEDAESVVELDDDDGGEEEEDIMSPEINEERLKDLEVLNNEVVDDGDDDDDDPSSSSLKKFGNLLGNESGGSGSGSGSETPPPSTSKGKSYAGRGAGSEEEIVIVGEMHA